MAVSCENCDRTFGTRRALQQHLRDAPAHATAFDCDECGRAFDTEEALQQHLRDSPAHATTFDCDECGRAFDTEEALQQHLQNSPAHVVHPAAGLVQSFDLQPSLHNEVLQSLRPYGLAFDFFTADDPHGALAEYDTSIMGTFVCAQRSCPTDRWTSYQIAITIRRYPGGRYNARVYFQRCESCDALSRPELDESYAARVAYRLARWSGVAVETPPYSGRSTGRHQSSLCEGCRYGRCRQSRL